MAGGGGGGRGVGTGVLAEFIRLALGAVRIMFSGHHKWERRRHCRRSRTRIKYIT